MKKQLINIELHIQISRGHHGLDRMVVGFLTTTFNNISATSWRSVLLVEETGEPGENH
jgi:hypothetical protein